MKLNMRSGIVLLIIEMLTTGVFAAPPPQIGNPMIPALHKGNLRYPAMLPTPSSISPNNFLQWKRGASSRFIDGIWISKGPQLQNFLFNPKEKFKVRPTGAPDYSS